MADHEDRTEPATAKRQQRARSAGQAPLSREVAGLAVLSTAAAVIMIVLPSTLPTATRDLGAILANASRMPVTDALTLAAHAIAIMAAPFVAASLVAGSLAVLLQTGFLIHGDSLMPDLSRLDPRRGLRRICGPATLLETAKALLKLSVAGYAGWNVMSAILPRLGDAMILEPASFLHILSSDIEELVITMLAVKVVIAGADVVRERVQHARSLRMSRHEVREEQKESEGDPRIKARIKALRRQRARRRMMAAVPKATVVVTNPTHYAVALAYNRGTGDAPRVVAKGVDAMAARIREIAREHRVPLVANPPLARALHLVELDAQIPADHYKAVAELIAYVWGLSTRRAGAP
jgi:flagellar biosynthetic protein FlhB